VFSTVCIAAGGYIINNILDVESDMENKPQDVIVGKTISETKAYNLYIAFTFMGVVSGFYLSNVIGKPSFSALFIVIAATLYQYAAQWKQSLLIGNFIVALLASVSVLIIGVFDLYPITNVNNRALLALIFQILIDFAVFAFMINLLREIIKDLEDKEGDASQGMHTLPIVLGIRKTSKLVFGLSFIPILALLFYIYNNLFQLQFATLYLLVFVLGPLLLFTVKIWNARTKKDFHGLSLLLKWILFFGIIAIIVISLNMKYNA
jgi:4-hydroxybenzoate polyprenyltransferase